MSKRRTISRRAPMLATGNGAVLLPQVVAIGLGKASHIELDDWKDRVQNMDEQQEDLLIGMSENELDGKMKRVLIWSQQSKWLQKSQFLTCFMSNLTPYYWRKTNSLTLLWTRTSLLSITTTCCRSPSPHETYIYTCEKFKQTYLSEHHTFRQKPLTCVAELVYNLRVTELLPSLRNTPHLLHLKVAVL